jgi:hypothetical protein
MKGSIFAFALFLVSAAAVRAETGVYVFSCTDRELAGSHEVLRCRYDLEMRRAGGPRSETLERILLETAVSGDLGWALRAIDDCRDRLADCHAFSADAAKLAERGGNEAKWAKHVAAVMADETAVADMRPKDRNEFYLRALRERTAEEGGVRIYGGDVMRRVLRQRILPLFAAVESACAEGSLETRNICAHVIPTLKAVGSSNPATRLLELVRQAVGKPTDQPSQLAAYASLDQLRRLNLEGTAERLKEVVKLYEPLKEAYERKRLEMREEAGRKRPLLPRGWERGERDYLGVLGAQIIEVIGDLGDREFERAALGRRTLWDAVRDVELRLVNQGKLLPSEMVSQ